MLKRTEGVGVVKADVNHEGRRATVAKDAAKTSLGKIVEAPRDEPDSADQFRTPSQPLDAGEHLPTARRRC